MINGFLIALAVFLTLVGLLGAFFLFVHPEHADWKGALRRRFRLSRMRCEWGRACYVVDCTGKTRACWWEWEKR